MHYSLDFSDLSEQEPILRQFILEQCDKVECTHYDSIIAHEPIAILNLSDEQKADLTKRGLVLSKNLGYL